MSWQEFIKSRLATWVLGPILIVVLLFAARILVQKRAIDRQIKNLQAEADEVKQGNQQLGDLIKYFNTPGYQEKQAREKLNLKKEGEYVVVLPNDQEVEAAAQGLSADSKSNMKLWFNYFFHSN